MFATDITLSVELVYAERYESANKATLHDRQLHPWKVTDISYTENMWVFFVLLLGIVMVPGMDMLFVLANALTGGPRAGLCATFGIMVGGVVHTFFGTIGVGVLMKLAPRMFTVLIFAGAAYMAWIGMTLVRSSISVDSVGATRTRSPWMAFRQGAVTCILNPKAYLFVFSVYPQFMRPQYGSLWPQAIVMGTMTVLTQFGIYGGLALAAGRSRQVLTSRPGATAFVGRAVGYLFLVIAVLAAWHGWADGSFRPHR
jgi:threonine/homoserine/homoserine lactone efflux protein